VCTATIVAPGNGSFAEFVTIPAMVDVVTWACAATEANTSNVIRKILSININLGL
jgi:hypothetical protein